MFLRRRRIRPSPASAAPKIATLAGSGTGLKKPRISPPGNAVVWMFRYSVPANKPLNNVVLPRPPNLRLLQYRLNCSSTRASYRRGPGGFPAIQLVCRQFVELCRRLKLFTGAVVAIDGSKFKAVNNRDKNYTVAKVTGRMEQVNASIARYLRALDQADREESDIAEAKSGRLKEE